MVESASPNSVSLRDRGRRAWVELSVLSQIATLVFLAGCEAPESRGARNVILLSIDTLRSDHLGAYGYSRPTSPVLDALARDGVRFTESRAASSWTIPSHATMLTGLYSNAHGVDGLRKVLPDEMPSLPRWFGDAGFETAAIVNARVLQHRQGKGLFDHFQEIPPNMRLPRGMAPQVNAAVLDWLDNRIDPDRRFFLFLHYYDVHSDYTALPRHLERFSEPYDGSARGTNRQLVHYFRESLDHWGPDDARHLRNLYDSGIRQLDSRLQVLIEGLRDRGVLAETAIVLTSDHGEEFLEHGSVLHSRTLYEEQLQVPMIIVGPNVPRGRVIEGASHAIDIAPTVLSLAGLEAPTNLPGIDLSEAWKGGLEWPIDRALFAETDEWVGQVPGGTRRAIVRGRWKLLLDRPSGAIELYDLETDPGERNNLSLEEPAIRDQLMAELEDFMAKKRWSKAELEIDEKTAGELRALGYAP